MRGLKIDLKFKLFVLVDLPLISSNHVIFLIIVSPQIISPIYHLLNINLILLFMEIYDE